MTMLRFAAGLLTVTAIALVAAAPAVALEEEVPVPPENSAVNQYTEAFPTAGGDRDAHNHRSREASPAKVIGARNAGRLHEQGPDGRATAELAAETAPNVIVVKTPSSGGGGGEAGALVPTGNGGGAGAGPTGEPARNGSAPTQSPTTTAGSNVTQVGGSSGLSEILSRATGSGSGGMGIFLPLLLIAAVIWAVTYATRQRRPAS